MDGSSCPAASCSPRWTGTFARNVDPEPQETFVPSLSASAWGNRMATRFKPRQSCPLGWALLFLDVHFQPSPHRRRGTQAAPGQTRLRSPPRRGPPRYLVVVQVGQRQRRAQSRRGAQPVQQGGELPRRQAVVGPKDAQHIAGEGRRGRLRRVCEHLHPRECGECRWAQHGAAPPHWPALPPPLPTRPGQCGAGEAPARLGPSPGGRSGETGRAGGSAPLLRTGRAPLPCGNPPAPAGAPAGGRPAIRSPGRGRAAYQRQPTPAGRGLRAVGGPPRRPVSLTAEGWQGAARRWPHAQANGEAAKFLVAVSPGPGCQGSQNHWTHPRRYTTQALLTCPKVWFQMHNCWAQPAYLPNLPGCLSPRPRPHKQVLPQPLQQQTGQSRPRSRPRPCAQAGTAPPNTPHQQYLHSWGTWTLEWAIWLAAR